MPLDFIVYTNRSQNPLDSGAICYGFYSESSELIAGELAGGSPAATHFSLLRQRKVSKRKATPLPATPALRFGAPCGAQPSRGLVQTRLRLKQARALIRLDLRSSAPTEGVGPQTNTSSSLPQSMQCALCSPESGPQARCGWACVALKKRDQGRALFERNAVKRVCAAPRFLRSAQVAP